MVKRGNSKVSRTLKKLPVFKKMVLGAVFSSLLWIGIVFLSMIWNLDQNREQLHNIALNSAQSLFQQIVLTREWAALHGGVYVPVTNETLPNPYLVDPDRDIDLSSGTMLTKMNPSYITRQISELARRKNGLQFHLTSLKSVRPQNSPDDWEAAALREFESGGKEKGQFIKKNKALEFVYMAPLHTKKSCLKCHSEYSEGDILGGIRVSIPMPHPPLNRQIYLGHLLFALLGIAGITLFWSFLSSAYGKIQYQALFDSLTGIANRRSFTRQMIKEFKRSKRNGEPLAVLMCDIDNFKGYNDTYGHARGDKCLTRVAQATKRSLRRPSDFCARYGGEEFVVILPETDNTGALRVAGNILENVRKLEITHSKTKRGIITLSIGIAINNESAPTSHDELIQLADTALYNAKQAGKDRAATCTSVIKEQS